MVLDVDSRHNSYANVQEPYAFRIGKRPLEINEVEDRWLAAPYSYFKVKTDDGARYILRHDKRVARWEMILFEVV